MNSHLGEVAQCIPTPRQPKQKLTVVPALRQVIKYFQE